MTDTEILQKLIELALCHDFQLPPYSNEEEPRGIYYWEVDNILSGPVGGEEEGVMLDETENCILFNHAFIQALCRSRIPKEVTYQGVPVFLDGGLKDWEMIIRNLAISTNRLGYLAKEFL